MQYWLHSIRETNRIGVYTYTSNQSLTGVLARFGATGTTATALWLVASLVVLGIGVVAMHRAHTAALPVLVLSLNGLVGLLVSPISWSHHWVWSVPALLGLGWVVLTVRSRAAAVLLGVGALVFALAPQWRLPHDNTSGIEVSWAVWQKVVGNSYAWWALALLVVAALAAHRWSPREGPA